MDDISDEALEVKLALVGIGIWSNEDYIARRRAAGQDVSDQYRPPRFSIATLETAQDAGVYFFSGSYSENNWLLGWFPTKRAAMNAAWTAVLQGRVEGQP